MGHASSTIQIFSLDTKTVHLVPHFHVATQMQNLLAGEFVFSGNPITQLNHKPDNFPSLQNELRIVGFVYYNVIGPIFQKMMQFQMGRTLKKKGRKDLIPKVVPNYPPGCKRITISENYLETLAEQHVHVVRDNIVAVDGNKLTTATGETAEFDILVLATGYKVQEFLGPFEGKSCKETLFHLCTKMF